MSAIWKCRTPITVRKVSLKTNVRILSVCFSESITFSVSAQHLRKDLLHSWTGRLWNTVRRVRIAPSCWWECPHRRSLFGLRGLLPTRPPRPNHYLGLAARALLVTLCWPLQGRQPRTPFMYCPAPHLHALVQSWSESGHLSSGRIKSPS